MQCLANPRDWWLRTIAKVSLISFHSPFGISESDVRSVVPPPPKGATPRGAVQAREHGGLTPAKSTRVLLTRALARGKRAGEIGLGGRPGGDGDRAQAVG